MAKLTAALVLLLTALAAVSAMASDRCESEMEQKMPMRNCMTYMQSKMRGPYINEETNRREEEENLEKCCSEIRRFSSECRCDAVKEMIMDMPHLESEMKRMACSLPSKCEMSPCACPRRFA